MWDGHLESRKNPDRLQRSIHVDRIGVHSTFVYIYAGLRALMIWANCLFSFNMSFLLRKVEDVTTGIPTNQKYMPHHVVKIAGRKSSHIDSS